MSDLNREFPQYLSRPLQVLWWETDDLMLMLTSFVLSLIFGGWVWFSIIFVPFFYSRMKKSQPRGFLVHTLYYIGFLNFKNYPTYFEKDFLE